jgi:RNA polymerase sigma-70 factor (ECF subfamily)
VQEVWQFAAEDRVNSSFIRAQRFPILTETQGTSAGSPLSHEDFSDEDLLQRIAQGQQEALGRLFQRYARIIRSIASRILRDGSEADDLVQDLFLFIQNKSSFFDHSKGSAGSWIIQMAYQRAIERRRRLAVRHFYKHEDLTQNASRVVGLPTTEQDYSAEVVFGRNGLEKLVEELSEQQRQTLQLYFFEGYTLAEIGEKTGQPLGNVRNHYYRALDKLRRQMFGRKVSGGGPDAPRK